MNLVVKKKGNQKYRYIIPPSRKKKRASLHLRKPGKKNTNSLRIKCDGAEGEEKKNMHGQAVFCVSVGHSNLLHNNSDNKSAFIHHQRQHSSWTTMVCFQ